ncbi:hypothetical protein HMSSN139_66500 [Paenibacillus sp. HMSSN-139]|nr:hypothetical protein HMSSN139_66500 [Paenibacillus sp. HMSSN-139]
MPARAARHALKEYSLQYDKLPIQIDKTVVNLVVGKDYIERTILNGGNPNAQNKNRMYYRSF